MRGAARRGAARSGAARSGAAPNGTAPDRLASPRLALSRLASPRFASPGLVWRGEACEPHLPPYARRAGGSAYGIELGWQVTAHHATACVLFTSAASKTLECTI